MLDEIKKMDPSQDYDARAKEIKAKYERLGLVPTGFIPNPTASNIAAYLLDKLAAFGRALIEIMAKYASDLRREIRIEPSVTLQLGIEVGWSPKITIGIEGKGGGQRSVDEG
jgi:hypothetical protein